MPGQLFPLISSHLKQFMCFWSLLFRKDEVALQEVPRRTQMISKMEKLFYEKRIKMVHLA